MRLDRGSLGRHRRGVDVRDHLHRMRIAHRQRADFDRAAADLEFVGERAALGLKRNARRLELRHAHVHGDAAVGFEPRHDDAGQRADADFGLLGEPLFAHETHEAARAVAALLDLAAVGIENAVVEIGARRARRLDLQNLVAADAEMAVGDAAQLVAVERRSATRVASSTTKSLPRPCILVNFRRIPGGNHGRCSGP